MKLKKKKKGFTLVELLIVIGISGILMAMAAPKYEGVVAKATQLEQRSHVREILSYIDLHNLEIKGAITEEETLKVAEPKIKDVKFTTIMASSTIEKENTIKSLRTYAEKGSPLLVP